MVYKNINKKIQTKKYKQKKTIKGTTKKEKKVQKGTEAQKTI